MISLAARGLGKVFGGSFNAISQRQGFNQLAEMWSLKIRVARASVEMFKSHGCDVTLSETDGGFTWENWSKHLHGFAPKLFQ
jgi:hypothetical protein